MTTAIAVPGNTAATFLTHFFGTGLADDTYVVERFKARADGDIRPWAGESPAPAKKKGRRGAKRATASLKAVQGLRPARTEIIVCTGLKTRGGVQIRGDYRDGDFPRPQGAGLTTPAGDVRPATRRPGAPRPDSDPGSKDTAMTEQDIEIRRGRDLERYHRQTAERREAERCMRWKSARWRRGSAPG